MAGLANILTPFVVLLQGIVFGAVPIVTVVDHIPEVEPADSALPAIYLDVLPPSVDQRSSKTRTMVWPIDLLLVTEKRGIDVAGSVFAIYAFADAVIARIDGNATLSGTLRQPIQYDDPAISADDTGSAFGLIGWGQKTYVGTRIHTLLTVDRTGGFSA